MNTPYFSRLILLFFPLCVLAAACSKDDTSTPAPTVLKHWDIALNAKFEAPAPAGRSETGTAMLDMYSDMTMKYTITVTGLAAGDQLSAGHIHTGDPMTSGPVILGFDPIFTGGTATGKVAVRSTLADSIINNTTDFYVNVHSTQVPGGLLRGQLDNPVTFAQDVVLSGTNEVPAVTTTATGLALFRLTANKILYAKYTVTGLEAGDVLTASHVHTGAAGVNGPVIIPVCGSAADFGKALKLPALTDANVTLLTTGQVYANAHSQIRPGGIVRGQLR
ncbi:MAG: CHRD domain-containing protein [Chitinophagaceae bacterium]